MRGEFDDPVPSGPFFARECEGLRRDHYGTIVLFRLACAGDRHLASTSIEIEGRPPIQRTVRLQVFDEGGLLNEELKHPSRDQLYEEVLLTLSDIV